ncbi:integral membrane protein 2Ba isoform X1 [Denticeps clupeoides]|uniref:Integral membrane protein 2 n=1 Tax=Denticeps clupeoides TaxID=299321 RepID=A0AAY4BZH0_9TELE|nr:integral membrane protein 2B isoform X1 [Denticeps clupeoides]
MVKLAFNAPLGQKDLKKDGKDEALIPDERDVEEGVYVRQQSRAWCWCMCLGLALLLSGVVVGGAYLYRYYFLAGVGRMDNNFQMKLGGDDEYDVDHLQEEGRVYFCGVGYREEDYMIQEEEEVMPAVPLRRIHESVRILEDDSVELINVPVPEFSQSDPADIVHDFNRRLTAYLDLKLNKCYVIPLNTSIVMPPKDFLELLKNIEAGTYLPQSYLVHEQMMVTEKLDNIDQLGLFIYNLCRGKDTYKLQRKETVLGLQKREALNCHKIRHFENKFVVETMICEP